MTQPSKKPDQRGNADRAMSSETPTKGNPMNAPISITETGKQQLAAAKERLDYWYLEGSIHDVVNMSDLSADVLSLMEKHLTTGDGIIGKGDIDRLSFVVNHTASLASRLLTKWNEVHASNHDAGRKAVLS